MKLTARMLSHPCRRYQWYVVNKGFKEFDTVRNWKYNVNRSIENWGVEFFRDNLFMVEPIDKQELGGLYTTTRYSVLGRSESLPLEHVPLDTRYALYARAYSTRAYARIDQVKPHKVNVNLTLEALLNYHILAMRDEYYDPLVILIQRDDLDITIKPLFQKLPKFAEMSQQFFESTIEVIESSDNIFAMPKTDFHCSKCVFRSVCQKDLLQN